MRINTEVVKKSKSGFRQSQPNSVRHRASLTERFGKPKVNIGDYGAMIKHPAMVGPFINSLT